MITTDLKYKKELFGIQILIDRDNIVQLNYPKEIELSLEDAIEIDKTIIDIVQQEDFYLLINLKNSYGKMSSEAQQYFAKNAPSIKQIKSCVIILNSLPIRILVKFFLQVVKPKYPTKVMYDLNEARAYLESQVRKNQML